MITVQYVHRTLNPGRRVNRAPDSIHLPMHCAVVCSLLHANLAEDC